MRNFGNIFIQYSPRKLKTECKVKEGMQETFQTFELEDYKTDKFNKNIKQQ